VNRRVAGLAIALLQVTAAAADQVAPPRFRRPDVRTVASELETELRTPTDPMSPLQHVRIAVDVSVPAGSPTHRLTRKRLVGLAAQWRRMLSDTRRMTPRCIPMPLKRGIACMQLPRMREKDADIGLFLHYCGNATNLELVRVVAVDTMDDVRALLTSKVEACNR
jgi:hypothetical protein